MRLTHYQTRSHPVDFFFAATVNKAQGATLERVVVFLPDRRKHEYKGTTVPSRTMRWSSHAAYTALSRVRLAAHMRCIGEGFEQTKESIANDMTFKPKIHAFMHGAINSLIRFAPRALGHVNRRTRVQLSVRRTTTRQSTPERRETPNAPTREGSTPRRKCSVQMKLEL